MRIGTLISTGLATVLAASALAGAASAQSAVRVGQTVTGELTASDPIMEVDGSSYDCHILSTQAGQTYTIDLTSNDFDTFIGLGRGRACQPPVIDTNDDRSENDTNALLTFTSEGGDYFILANSYEAGERGRYSLTVSASERRAASSAQAPALSRPSDPDARYEYDLTCAAIGTLGMIELMQSEMSDAELQQVLSDNYTLLTNAEESGAARGKSADTVSNEVADLAAGIMSSPDLLDQFPPVPYRQACLSAA